ncbi:integrase-like protein [Chitinophaga niastensis]|uniref:Integrase-like protein n=1 Tax=Chitinophaga niastensis TaxID=536980 RepID=A0A2P8HDE2_CHINA|nr:Arm DNA-binding domain-containing protein [Chitinophaga niastensis]PSL44151.1 integrase-like protein [Chitinophaga niastensis]
MAKITPMLDEKYQHNDDTYPIVIRITNKNQTKYKPVEHSVLKTHFKRGTSDWVKEHPDAIFLNALIESKRALLNAKIIQLQLKQLPFNFEYVMSDDPITEIVDLKPKYTLGDILDKIANRHFENNEIG